MKTLLNKADLVAFVSENKGKKVVLDVYADWCGPCKIMTPVFENVIADVGSKVVAAKLDSDGLRDDLEAHNISITTIPRFLAIQITNEGKLELLEDMGGTQTKTALIEKISHHLT